ncbi:hypothetical protein THASP1DRAFT_34034 [Thamnocephalis sphaerospora]|uniref:Ubiquitin carboxyl-terminal hydrolase n=1 Tax=Thamnocephalis sphaerospora TaxID=78915 RepID=A0A4P9XZ56_9FUNG|nr:hypothetical protein THASP1DRAFT_34034 [Thamnocephalis sphaerospora]|eukprot:RKP10740.1 hypothetical protein THASP1DRAFT_34034 [Thamnocephalis sphaerospora]
MAELCPHVLTTPLRPPGAFTTVHREECTQCFDTQDAEHGLNVCLSCFNGGCTDAERCHGQLHATTRGHPLALNVRRLRKEKPERAGDEQPPQKITKLAIIPGAQEDEYEYETRVLCLLCGGVEVDRTLSNLPEVVDGVMNSLTASKQSEIKAWEAEIVACDHIHQLQQQEATTLSEQSLAHCSQCELNGNLWLCLVCGNLGCGRKQYDGTGGNGHGLDHYATTGHALSCKLGTITPEGTADVYCYQCDDERLDPNISAHLAHFGIQIAAQQKTEKSMAELQLEQNLKFDFSMTTEDGRQLQPLFGPGYTGLKNLGNSCYMASILQSVFALPAFRSRYAQGIVEHHASCTASPAGCFQCQMHKLADGLWSGRYSVPNELGGEHDGEASVGQDGIAPAMFKELVGKDHAEFSTMRQQDVLEFFEYLVKTTEMRERASGADPTRCFRFRLEERLQCFDCKRVRYRQQPTNCLQLPVPARRLGDVSEEGAESQYERTSLQSCFDAFASTESLEWRCPQCERTTVALKTTRFATLPEVLVVCLRRFELRNWVPVKLPVPVEVPQDIISFENIRGQGLCAGEEPLPETDEGQASAATTGAVVDEGALEQLVSMGFPEPRCRKALLATGNAGAEVAMNWLFEHSDDPDIDAPLETPSSEGTKPPPELVAMLADMGFTEAQATKALRETSNSMDRAVEWLFSHPDDQGDIASEAAGQDGEDTYDSHIPANYRVSAVVSHRGTSVHCGHYVAHVRKDGRWVLFNDNKVAAADALPEADVYLLVLERV